MNQFKKHIFIFAAAIAAFACSCKKQEAQQYGYLQIGMNTLVSVIDTKAATDVPEGYNPRQLYVKIVNKDGNIVKSTKDFDNDKEMQGLLKLEPGLYTIIASSNGWDGSQSADVPFYAGSASCEVVVGKMKTVDVVCTLATVKVSVDFDDSFRSNFQTAGVGVESLLGSEIHKQNFEMGAAGKNAVYFPVGDIKLTLDVVNNNGQKFSRTDVIDDVQARQHIKITYKVAKVGNMGGITVKTDDSTNTYEFTVWVLGKPGISFNCYKPAAADIWSRSVTLSAEITGKTSDFDANLINLQWRTQGAADWATVPMAQLQRNGDFIEYSLKGLTPNTKYEFRIHYDSDDQINSDAIVFTTAKEEAIYNPGFENWWMDGKVAYPNETNKKDYWNTSNPGSASFGGSVTTQTTSFVHSGSSAAELRSKYIVVKFAAASIFTGNFIGLIGTNGAKLDWGVPFTSRPTALKGWWSYTPGSINQGNKPSGVNAPDKGQPDACQIFCILLTEQLHVGGNAEKDGYEKSTTIDWENDPRIIAYGELSKNTSSNGQWEEFNVPLKYHTTTELPKYMAIVCAASKWGDYFYGSDSTVLYLDDLELDYSGTPIVK